MNDQANRPEAVETLPPSGSQAASPPPPDPTAEEAQRTLALANASTASPPAPADERTDIANPPLKTFEDPRNKIAENFSKTRNEGMRGTTEDYNDARLTDPTNQLLEQANGTQPQPQPAPAPAAPKVKVKVDGVEKEVELEELVKTYQKDQTADVRLQEATRLLNEAKNTVAAVPKAPTKTEHESDSATGSTSPTKTETDSPTDELAGASDEELTEVAESLMTGSTADAVKALKKVLKRPAPQSQQPADISTQVDKAIALREENQLSAKALEQFGTKYGQVKTDKVVGAAVIEIIRDELLTDIKAAGVPDVFIEQFHLTEPAGFHVLKETHKLLRANGREGVRKTDDILGVVEKNPTFLKLIAPNVQPVPQIQVDRGARKEGVQAQPVSRNAPPPSSPQAQPRPGDRAAAQSAAVEQMRKQRGQGSYA